MRHTSTIFTRRRTESMLSSTGSVTPADELTSWLGDDVCTTCGAGVGSGQLYCSQECREEDSSLNNNATNSDDKPSTSAPAKSSSASQLYNPRRQSDKVSVWNRSQQNSSDSDSGKFRYVCPPSPHAMATKYGSHLTSPALAALDRQPVTQPTNTEKEWTSSSERRSSSRSTYSSASDALSTDPSTPSPLLARTANDDLDELDHSDFNLPPSVFPAGAHLRDTFSLEGKQTHARRSPAHFHTGLPPAQPVLKRDHASMSFARRPSRTNVPPPVLFTSPVLATTMMKAASGNRRESAGQGSSPKSTEAQKLASSWQQAKQQLHDAHTTVVVNNLHHGKRVSIVSGAAAVPVGHRNTNAQLVRKIPSSPPLPTSASSSAGRTLRAMSPPSAAVSLSSEPAGQSVCGRFGCQGFSGSSGTRSVERTAAPSLTHKHTHSANAGLNLLGGEDSKSAALKSPLASSVVVFDARPVKLGAMTPLPQGGQAPPSTTPVVDPSSVKSPPRGRSKARGRSSTSRRSPSPPRGAARRGRSEDVRSITGALSGLTMAPKSKAYAVETQNDADDEDDERQGRRGRSPTERLNLASRTKASAQPTRQATVTSISSGGGATIRGVEMPFKETSGYDDVDLDEL